MNYVLSQTVRISSNTKRKSVIVLDIIKFYRLHKNLYKCQKAVGSSEQC